MDKIYVVHGDNGEAYEDGWDWIESIFTSGDYAVEYIENELGCVKTDDKWRETWKRPKYVCSMNNIDCYDCPKYDKDDDEIPCEEYDERMDNEWDSTYFYIQCYEVKK